MERKGRHDRHPNEHSLSGNDTLIMSPPASKRRKAQPPPSSISLGPQEFKNETSSSRTQATTKSRCTASGTQQHRQRRINNVSVGNNSFRGIQAFAKVTKVHVRENGNAKKIGGGGDEEFAGEKGEGHGGRKRKRDGCDAIGNRFAQEDQKGEGAVVGEGGGGGGGDASERECNELISLTPKRQRVDSGAVAGINDTPTKGTRSLLEKMAFGSSSPATLSSPLYTSTEQSPRTMGTAVSTLGPSQGMGRRKRARRDSTPPSSPPSKIEAPSRKKDGGSRQQEEGTLQSSLSPFLRDFAGLQSSFLTALSLHYAHYNPSNPVDLRELCPSVEKIWRKRRVTVEDLRRVVALSYSLEEVDSDQTEGNITESAGLRFTDYGHSKVCLEIADASTGGHLDNGAQPRSVIDESALKTTFALNLRRTWAQQKVFSSNSGTPSSEDAFILSMPLAPIQESASSKILYPLFAKGQQRQRDLKASAIEAQKRVALTPRQLAVEDPNHKPSVGELKDSSVHTHQREVKKEQRKSATNRASALLDRLHAKALNQRASQPLRPPTAEEIARRRALQRVAEIASVVTSLALEKQQHDNSDTLAMCELERDGANGEREVVATAQRKSSFTMSAVVSHLQMSLRNPIGAEEGHQCVRILSELVPEWVEVWELCGGKVCGVVVKGFGVGRGILENRAKVALEKL